VLFLNSSAWLRHRPKLSGYSGSQHALRVMADALRDEVNEHGVGVTSLYLGRTLTRRIARLFAEEQRAYDPALLLQPQDVADAVLFALLRSPHVEITDLSLCPAIKSY
jgi:NADP-dependent 3-hydroxy acid dehydrogenase YdfG